MKKKIPTTYVLRTCGADMRATHEKAKGFLWPASGPVSAPDWDPTPKCGRGLHGLAMGEGNADLLDSSACAKWLVVRVRTSEIVKIDDQKVKFPRGIVVYCGDRARAVAKIQKKHPYAKCVYGTSTSGYGGTSTSGYGGTSTSGVYGTSTSGDRGTSTSGYGGTSTSGVYGTSTSGDYGTSTSGDYGTSTSGYGGTSTSGYGGTSTSGVYGTSTSGVGGTSTSGVGGTSTSGVGGTSTSGDYGTSTSGDHGTSTSGERGILHLTWYDAAKDRRRVVTAYVGENGIRPNTAYRLNEAHEVVEVSK